MKKDYYFQKKFKIIKIVCIDLSLLQWWKWKQRIISLQNIEIEKRLTTLFSNFYQRYKSLYCILQIIWFKRYFRFLKLFFFFNKFWRFLINLFLIFFINNFLNFLLLWMISFLNHHSLLIIYVLRFQQSIDVFFKMKWPEQVTGLVLMIRCISKFNW